MKHVMIDLETLGTSPGSVILSIGAVAFDIPTKSLGQTFYVNVCRQQAAACGLTSDPSTIAWWAGQSQEARDALLVDPVAPDAACRAFVDYWRMTGATMIWSHGATFDIPLLEWMIRLSQPMVPWKFWNARDTRTIFDLAGNGPDRSKGTHHNALDDAVNQAEAVIAACGILGKVI